MSPSNSFSAPWRLAVLAVSAPSARSETESVAAGPRETGSRRECGQWTSIFPAEVAQVSDGLFPSSAQHASVKA